MLGHRDVVEELNLANLRDQKLSNTEFNSESNGDVFYDTLCFDEHTTTNEQRPKKNDYRVC